jgi:hypothetical protein
MFGVLSLKQKKTTPEEERFDTFLSSGVQYRYYVVFEFILHVLERKSNTK